MSQQERNPTQQTRNEQNAPQPSLETEIPGKHSILDNLEGIIRNNIREEIIHLAKKFKKDPPLIIIVCGIPGSGKSTLIEEMNDLFEQEGFDVSNITYEEAFEKNKPKNKADMDSIGWMNVNKMLLHQLHDFLTDTNSSPSVCFVEIPGISEKVPHTEHYVNEEKNDLQNNEQMEKRYNRDRGVSFLMELSDSVGYDNIFVLSLTSDITTQLAAMKERQEILTDNPSQQALQLVSSMATFIHLEKMLNELKSHMPQLVPTVSEEPLRLLLRLRGVSEEDIDAQNDHYKQELETLMLIFTSYYWLVKLRVSNEHIIVAHNPYNPKLIGGHRKKFNPVQK